MCTFSQRWSIVGVLIAILNAPSAVAQPSVAGDVLWDLGPVAKRAVKELKNAYDVVQHLSSNAEKIQNGVPPDAKNKSLQGVSEKLRDVAAAIEKESLPTDFDEAPYRVSVAEFTNCQTRAPTLAKIRGFLGELRAAETRGRQAVVDLAENVAVADKTDAAVGVLIKAHETVLTHGELAWVPVFKNFFELNWLDLTTVVRPAVGQVRSALLARQKKIDAELKKLPVLIENLQSNLSGLEKLTCLDGRWVSNDPDGRFTLDIKGTAVQWTERAKSGATLTRPASLVETSGRYRVERPNDDAVLAFLGYQPSLRQEILARGPQPSFLVVAPQNDQLNGEWHGILVTKTSRAKLDKLIQPSQSPAKTMSFRLIAP